MTCSKSDDSKVPQPGRASRRVFARGLGGLIGVSCVGEVARPDLAVLGLRPTEPEAAPPPRRLATVGELEPGVIINFDYPDRRAAFLVRLRAPANGGVGPGQDIVAFHRACPHMGCPLTDLDVDRGELGPCECHLSLFDLRRGGLQIHGLASQPVVQVQLELRGDEIYAVGIQGLSYGSALEAKT